MSVTLTPQAEHRLQHWVDNGHYENVDEALAAAIQILDDNERRRHLRDLLASGLEQARGGELVAFTPELEAALDREAEAAFQRGDRPDPNVCP